MRKRKYILSFQELSDEIYKKRIRAVVDGKSPVSVTIGVEYADLFIQGAKEPLHMHNFCVNSNDMDYQFQGLPVRFSPMLKRIVRVNTKRRPSGNFVYSSYPYGAWDRFPSTVVMPYIS